MRISVKAKPGSDHEKVEKIDEANFIVSVKAPPVRGLANRAIIKVLAEYFNTSPLNVHIISGHTSRQKVVEIN
ncbi:MAG: DUF167 domain-containing protein [Candidatus Paceibacterota bacterium]